MREKTNIIATLVPKQSRAQIKKEDLRKRIRGGSWGNGAGYVRVSGRLSYAPSYRDDGLGFRLILQREK